MGFHQSCGICHGLSPLSRHPHFLLLGRLAPSCEFQSSLGISLPDHSASHSRVRLSCVGEVFPNSLSTSFLSRSSLSHSEVTCAPITSQSRCTAGPCSGDHSSLVFSRQDLADFPWPPIQSCGSDFSVQVVHGSSPGSFPEVFPPGRTFHPNSFLFLL